MRDPGRRSPQHSGGGGQPPPPMHPPPASPDRAPPPARKRHRSRWMTIGLPLGVLLVLGGCGTAVVLAVNALTGSLGPAMDVGSRYASALVDGRWEDAHALLCDDARARVTSEQLSAQYGRPPLTGYSIEGADVHSSGGRSTAEVTVRLVTEDGLDQLTVLPLVKDGDEWRPCP